MSNITLNDMQMFINDLSNSYPDHIFFISKDGSHVYTAAQFAALGVSTESYTAAYIDESGPSVKYYPMFELNTAQGSVITEAGETVDPTSGIGTSSSANANLIQTAYRSDVEPNLSSSASTIGNGGASTTSNSTESDNGYPVTAFYGSVLSAIDASKERLVAAAQATHLSVLEIASPIAREMNKSASGDYFHGGVGPALQFEFNRTALYKDTPLGIADLTEQDYQSDLANVISSNLSNRNSGGVFVSAYNRLTHPVLNDLGDARIKLETAMDAVQFYKNNINIFSNSDALDLLKYVNNTNLLAQNLINSDSLDTAISVEAVIAVEGDLWAQGHVSNWLSYSDNEKAAFITAFSATGQDYFDKQYNASPHNLDGGYTPDLSQSGPASYILDQFNGEPNGDILNNSIQSYVKKGENTQSQPGVIVLDSRGSNTVSTQDITGSTVPILLSGSPTTTLTLLINEAVGGQPSSGAAFTPGYVTSPGGSSFDSGSSPLDTSGTLTLPGTTGSPNGPLQSFLNDLNASYPGDIYYLSQDNTHVYTAAQFAALAPSDQSYTAAYRTQSGQSSNYYPMFQINTQRGTVDSEQGPLVSGASGFGTSTGDLTLIQTSYDDNVKPYIGPSTAIGGSSGTGTGGGGSSPVGGYNWTQSSSDMSIGSPNGSLASSFENDFYVPWDYTDDSDSDYSSVFSGSSDDDGYEDVDDDDGSDFDFGMDFPLVLNLKGQQVHTVSVQASNVRFNVTGTGAMASTGWITSGEGFLVLDPSGAAVTSAAQWVPSFAALAKFDTNGDGTLTAAEADAAGIKLWVDQNGDAVGSPNELYSLSALGIASINLNAALTGTYDNGNLIAADSTFTWTNGQKGDVADTYLMNGAVPTGDQAFKTANGVTTVSADGRVTEVLTGSGLAINMAASGVGTIIDRGTGNVITAGAAQDATIIGGAGSTLIASSAVSATIVGGAGSHIYGGSGTDVLVAGGDGSSVTTGTGINSVEVDGNGSTVDASQGTPTVVVNGTGDSVNTGTNAAATVTLNQSGNSVGATGATIVIGSGVSASIAGGSDAITENAGADMTATGSSMSVDMVGSGATATLTGGTVTLENGVTGATVSGKSDVIDVLGSGSTLTLTGTGDSVVMSSGSIMLSPGISASISGGSDAITEVGNDTVTSTGAGDTLVVSGTGNAAILNGGQVTVQAAAGLALTGNGFTIAEQQNATLSVTGTGSTLDVVGSGAIASISNGTVTIESGVTIALSGGSDAITETGNDTVTSTGVGDTLVVLGTGNAATLNGGQVTVQGGAGVALTGNGFIITEQQNATLSVNGTGSTLDVLGSGATATITKGTVTIEGGVTAAVSGTSDAITENAGATVTATGTSTSVDMVGSGATATLTGGTVKLESGVTGATVAGNADAISVQGTGGSLTLTGTGDSVTMTGGSVVLTSGISATLYGGSDAITEVGNDTLTSTGAGDVLLVSGTGNAATLNGGQVTVQGGAGVVLKGNGFVISEQQNATLAVSGTGSTLDMVGSGAAASIGSGTVTIEAGVTAMVSGTSDAITEKAGATATATGASMSVDMTGSGATATLTGGAVTLENGVTGAVVSGGNDGVKALGTGSTLTIGGLNDGVSMSQGTITLEAVPTSLTLSGTSDTVNAGNPGQSLTVEGTGDTINMSGDSVSLTAGLAETVNGVADSLSEVGKDTLTASGTAHSLYVLGLGNTASLGDGASVTVASTYYSQFYPGGGEYDFDTTITGGNQASLALTANNAHITETGMMADVSATGTGIRAVSVRLESMDVVGAFAL